MPSLAHRASFYVVHHSGFLDPFLDADEHPLRDCDLNSSFPRSETMAETAPLLPQLNHVPRDHLIFLCVCHSPWPFLHQTGLLIVRGALAVYLTAVLALSVVKDCEGPYARFLAFDARYLSFATQVIYYWITAVRLPPKHGATRQLQTNAVCIDMGDATPAGIPKPSRQIATGRTGERQIPCKDAKGLLHTSRRRHWL